MFFWGIKTGLVSCPRYCSHYLECQPRPVHLRAEAKTDPLFCQKPYERGLVSRRPEAVNTKQSGWASLQNCSRWESRWCLLHWYRPELCQILCLHASLDSWKLPEYVYHVLLAIYLVVVCIASLQGLRKSDWPKITQMSHVETRARNSQSSGSSLVFLPTTPN